MYIPSPSTHSATSKNVTADGIFKVSIGGIINTYTAMACDRLWEIINKGWLVGNKGIFFIMSNNMFIQITDTVTSLLHTI